METTLDKLLNGRFTVEQPKKGFRISVDTLLLASAVPVEPGQKLLELGCGVGGVMLAVATRVPDCLITGIELQIELATLCGTNIARNGFEGRLSVWPGDLTNMPKAYEGLFDHVAMNPPYHDGKSHGASDNAIKRTANTEGEVDLPLWLAQAAKALKPGGWLTLIHRADRADEIVTASQAHFGEMRIKPIWSKSDGTCKRVIIRSRKTDTGPVVKERPFILYGEDGRYSAPGDAILRNAEGMEF